MSTPGLTGDKIVMQGTLGALFGLENTTVASYLVYIEPYNAPAQYATNVVDTCEIIVPLVNKKSGGFDALIQDLRNYE